jgi:NADH-quinone oxidoreductase subunit C
VTDGEQAIAALSSALPEAGVGSGSYRGQHWVEVKLDRLYEVCRWLREDPQASFDYLVDVTAVHWPDDPQPMEMVYHLHSLERSDRLRVKARTGDTGPVPSLSDIWHSAAWNERETYDMFGIVFEGHPDLRRILMPDDYTDFPLRKELPLYRG